MMDDLAPPMGRADAPAEVAGEGATMTRYEEPVAERAVYQARRVHALLTSLENCLGEDRIGSLEFDITLRNLLDMAREETTILSRILEGDDQ
jgi:hypothetical protein